MAYGVAVKTSSAPIKPTSPTKQATGTSPKATTSIRPPIKPTSPTKQATGTSPKATRSIRPGSPPKAAQPKSPAKSNVRIGGAQVVPIDASIRWFRIMSQGLLCHGGNWFKKSFLKLKMD